MASKHDAKRARENMWVTQQNLARAKGGRPLYEHKQRRPLPAPKAAPALRPAAEQTPESAEAATESAATATAGTAADPS